MLFNTAKTRDFTPQLEVEGDTLEVVHDLKLLGVQVTSDLKWTANTVTKRRYGKLWILRRLKAARANKEEICDVNCKHVQSLLDYAAIVWHFALTIENSADIKRVQKSALSIILGTNYIH